MASFHQILPSYELGGAGLVALHIAHFLKAQGQRSQVWIPGAGPALCKAKSLGLSVQTYRPTDLFSSTKIKALTANLRTWWELSSSSRDLIHIHSPFLYRALLLGLQLSRSKTVVHVQLEEDEAGLGWAFKNPPDLIITCARFLESYVRRTLPEQYQKCQRIVAVSNPVDTQQFYPGDRTVAKHYVGAPLHVPLALMLANLAPHKGQEVAIRATALLKDEGVGIVLWLAGVERGEGRDYTRRLQKLCHELGVIDQVRFLGHRDDAPDLLRAADLFLLPSTQEGLPLSILEAQASKVPVLATSTGGIPEVVDDGTTGFLIPDTAIANYTTCIKILLQNHDLYHTLAEHAYAQIINEYTWQVYSQRIWALYQELILT